MDSEKKLLTQAEAAEYLGYAPRSLETLRAKRQGPPFVALSSRHIRYRRSDLDAFLERHVVETAGE
jgi:predicted DNA-binding transcriptional regulator AlpA